MSELDKEQRLRRLEEILPLVQSHLERFVSQTETITLLKLAYEDNKEFKARFKKTVTELIQTELGSADFHKTVNSIAVEQIHIFVQTDEFRDKIKSMIEESIDTKLREIQAESFWKLLGILSVVIAPAITFAYKHFLG